MMKGSLQWLEGIAFSSSITIYWSVPQNTPIEYTRFISEYCKGVHTIVAHTLTMMRTCVGRYASACF